jgi:hypothetical protein
MATKTINLNALAELTIATKFADQIVAVGKALQAKAEQGTNNAAANEKVTTTIKATVLDYANATAASGVPAPQANAALRSALMEMGFPQGTALNYGRAVEGFRRIAETGKAKDGTPLAIEAATFRDAQSVMESPETARKNELRGDIQKYVKAANESQLKDILDLVSGLGIKLPEGRGKVTVTAPEGETVKDANAEQEQAQAA